MTQAEARRLYIEAGGPADHHSSEWESIHCEMEAVVAAASDRAAGRIIDWWRCWDGTYTATAFARRVRELHTAKPRPSETQRMCDNPASAEFKVGLRKAHAPDPGPRQEDQGMGLQGWTTASDKFEPAASGLTRQDFPCCACKFRSRTDADEPCRSCGQNLTAVLDGENTGLSGGTPSAEAGCGGFVCLTCGRVFDEPGEPDGSHMAPVCRISMTDGLPERRYEHGACGPVVPNVEHDRKEDG